MINWLISFLIRIMGARGESWCVLARHIVFLLLLWYLGLLLRLGRLNSRLFKWLSGCGWLLILWGTLGNPLNTYCLFLTQTYLRRPKLYRASHSVALLTHWSPRSFGLVIGSSRWPLSCCTLFLWCIYRFCWVTKRVSHSWFLVKRPLKRSGRVNAGRLCVISLILTWTTSFWLIIELCQIS